LVGDSKTGAGIYSHSASHSQTDPTRPVTTLKTVWSKVREQTQHYRPLHDNRHTFITDLAESTEASDETIRDMAGHVSKQMLKHYSHIRMEAMKRALAALVVKPAAEAENSTVNKLSTKVNTEPVGVSRLAH
jgi:integrase